MQTSQKTTTISVAQGDGIGSEIMQAVLDIFAAARVPLEYEHIEMGKPIFDAGFSTGMTAQAKASIERNGILFKGPMETPKGSGVKSINVTARKTWSTYANKRVFRTLNGVDTVFSRANIPINLTIVRENIEDTYGGIEHMLTHDVALCRRFITRPGSLQLMRYAFEMAKRKGSKRVTCAHKANIMKITDGLFLECFREVAKDYPELRADDVIVDDLAMKLVSRPDLFDVVILPNLQGDIISDLCAGLVGGLGFAPSANIGDHISIFEAVHGTAPDIAGKGIANPTALLLSGCMMLRHLHLGESAVLIENALFASLEAGAHTADFGAPGTPALTTQAFAEVIKTHLGSKPKIVPPASFEPANDTISLPKVPARNRMMSTEAPASEIMGADFFIESTDQASLIADTLAEVCGNRYKISTISNRGTQVWPEGSVFTELINQYRVRFEKIDSGTIHQADIVALIKETSEFFKICSVELLMAYAGKKAYSMAQGQ